MTATAARVRGSIRADLVYVGWRQTGVDADPGAPPPVPGSPAGHGITPDWLAAQRREFTRLARPAWLAGAGSAAAAAALLAAGLAGQAVAVALPAACAAGIVSAGAIRRARRAQRALADRVRAEKARVTAFAELQRKELAARRAEYRQQYREWQRRVAAVRRQPQWYPVTLPVDVHRLDVAGGTLAGWSALLTTVAAARLASGGEVTVLDLTEGGVAADLIAVARRAHLDPLVWVLPRDLAHLELGTHLAPAELADVLARTAHSDPTADPAADLAGDAALLRRILQIVTDRGTAHPAMPAVIEALRCAGQLHAPGEWHGPGELDGAGQLRGAHAGSAGSGVLTTAQLAAVAALAGREAAQLAVERAWALESRLAVLETLATDLSRRLHSRLRVAWLDRRAPATSNGVLAAYLAVSLTAMLRQAPPSPRWQQTVAVLGAERLPAAVLEFLCDAGEISGTGLVLGYRAIPSHVRERLGRGHAAVGFMRLGNADDARLAAEQIGTEHRFVISQLTDTVGASVTDTIGVSYTSSVGSSAATTDSGSVTVTAGRSHGHGRSGPGAFAPFADLTGSASSDRSSSRALSDSRSITAGISTGTSWGWSTSRAVGISDSLARSAQRSRESLVEQHELQQLPQSAVVLSYPSAGGRQVVLADSNPAILTLPGATLASPP